MGTRARWSAGAAILGRAPSPVILLAVQEALEQLIARLAAPTPGAPVEPADHAALLERLGALRPLAGALLAGPAPREALLNLLKLLAAIAATAAAPPRWPEEGKGLRALVGVLSSGPELTRWLVRRPARLALLLDPGLGRAVAPAELAAELDPRLADLEDPTRFAEAVTAFRNEHYLRLAAGEFGLAPLEQVTREVSDLADLCLDRTVRFALARLSAQHGPPLTEEGRPCGLAIIAMGKHGAQELNFCSDVDVVFIYATDEGQAGDLSLHELFTKVCQLVTRLLSEPNAEGYSFRVDLRLRPEGARGPLCNSLAGAERYYETWGGPYDRLAWLKARACAGDLALGEEMVKTLRPFVFPRSIRPEVIGEIQELNRRIQTQRPAQAAAGWNVKLEAGSIREVEFFVQALQLLHAGKQPELQERATLRALDKLLFAGLISAEEHRALGESYELYRHLEHRLQLHDGRQTQLLPASGPIREQVIAHLGYERAAFEREVVERRARVSAIYATLGAPAVSGEESRLAPLLDPELEDARAAELLAAAGFTQTERAREALRLLAGRPWGPFAGAAAGGASRLALPLLVELSRSPDPDAALLHLTELALRVGPFGRTWALLEEEPPLVRLLCSVLGSSDYLARLFIRHPELVDQLLGGARGWRPLAALREELGARLAALEEGDVEARLGALAQFRGEEVLRIGLADIAGDLEQEEVWEQLSSLAEVILEQLYPLVLREARARYGTPRREDGSEVTLAILALGKLGGRELTYASDLDLIFVFGGEGVTDGPRQVGSGEFFSRVVQRLIRALTGALDEGSLYQVDTRLRPSGQQGALVSSFEAFRVYHAGAAEAGAPQAGAAAPRAATAAIWERQVLVKARPVGGDLELGEEVASWIRDFIYSVPVDGEELRREIHRLRTRMEKELAEEKDGFYNLKLGRGGLLDVDFITQYLQLREGRHAEALRVGPTLAGLEALRCQGVLAADDAATLIRGYRFLRRIESRLRIVRDRSAEHLPAAAEGLEVMARRLGYRQQTGCSAGDALLRDYREETEAVRQIYGRLLGGDCER